MPKCFFSLLPARCKVVGGEEVDFRAHGAGSGFGPPPEHGPSLAVERVAIGRAPEEVLLEGDGEVGDRSHGEAGTGTDDILPADVVDVPEEGVGRRVERVEGADVAAG